MTAVGAIAGGPLASLLPVLAKYPAAKRQQARIEAALGDIMAVLTRHEAALESMADANYKLLNESVLAIFQTTDTEKN